MGQNRETIQQLKNLATRLNNISFLMHAQYRSIAFLVYVELSCLVVILITFAFCGKIQRELTSILLSILWLFTVDTVTIMIYLRLRSRGKAFIHNFNEGYKILQNMADKTEWTRYKKRLIYNGNDNSINGVVNYFFSISEKIWSPRRSDGKYYSLLTRMLPIFVLYISLAFLLKIIVNFYL